uniref:Ig-like domain-containing protein n=1 Tax=Gouania willdenowi TaxID=441366 RepID=A0A8C5ND50_GOUWI
PIGTHLYIFLNNVYFFINALVQQSDSKTIHPGDSVTLKCTASTGSCDAEPSVYWFKNSEDHHPSLIYTQSDKNVSQCERKTKHTPSNAGTYYCAVTVCGRIVFGNGTRLELKGKKLPVPALDTQPHSMMEPPPNFTVGSKCFSWNAVFFFPGLSKCALAYLKRPRLWRVQRKGFFRITLPYSISLCKVR